MTTAIYPGTFNPIHNGHIDLVQRAAGIFDHIVVAVATSPQKKPSELDIRVKLVCEVLSHITNIEICGYDGLTVDFACRKGATVILKGIRTVTDFEFEFQQLSMNRALQPGLETIFLAPSEHVSYISSTLIRQINAYGGAVEQFVHPSVNDALTKGIF
jgi:pantetheine-phosphate adenylyltransferase